jgi:hypothetical protein
VKKGIIDAREDPSLASVRKLAITSSSDNLVMIRTRHD